MINTKSFLYKIHKYSFCEILGSFLSRKSGQKCCVYGQNGKPLKKETVIKFLDNMQATNNFEIQKEREISDFRKSLKLINWRPNEDHTILTRVFYFKNVFYLTDFIKEIYNTDCSANLQQIPNIHVLKKELLKIELTTPDLKGLSMKDLQLAFALNSLNYEKFLLYPIREEENYKREIRNITLFEQQNKGKDASVQERTKLKNKYDALQYEKLIENKETYNKDFENLFNQEPNLDEKNLNFKVNNLVYEKQNKIEELESNNDSGCCSPEGTCACKQASKYKL